MPQPQREVEVEGDVKRGEGTMPEDFPKDVPVYAGAQPTRWISASGMGAIATFTTEDDPARVFSFYRDGLPPEGWTLESQIDTPGRWALTAAKEQRKLSLSIAEREGRTEIGLAVTP